METLIRDVAADLVVVKDELNRLDGFAGDGDLGITVAAGASAIASIQSELGTLPHGTLLRRIGTELARHVPSTGGTLLATAFLAAAREMEAASQTRPETATELAARLLDAAQRAIVERGKAAPGDKTMLDAIAPASQALREAADAGIALPAALARAAEDADQGALATASMEPRHGRAAWLAERSAGHEDAGARAVAIILGSIARHSAELGDRP